MCNWIHLFCHRINTFTFRFMVQLIGSVFVLNYLYWLSRITKFVKKSFQLSRRVFINYKKIVCTLPARKKTWNPKHSSEVQGKKQNHFTFFVDPLGSWLLYPYSVCEFSMPIWASLILITISPIWTLFLATESRVQRFSGHHTTAASSDAYNLSGLLQLHVL